MSTEEVVVGHQDGPAWEIVAKCATYSEADQRRLELEMEDCMPTSFPLLEGLNA